MRPSEQWYTTHSAPRKGAQAGRGGVRRTPQCLLKGGSEGEEEGKAARVEGLGSGAKGPTPVVFLLWGAHAQSKAK